LAGELNVKAVNLVVGDAAAAGRFGIVERLAVNARAAGPRLGRGVQAAIKAAKAGDWRRDGDVVVVVTPDGDVPLEAGEYDLVTVVESADAATTDTPTVAAAVLPGGGFVVLDLALTPDLEAEGYARDVIRDVQDARKAAGLEVADRINLTLGVPADRIADVETHRTLISEETLAVALTVEASTATDRQIAVTKA
ncbi:MAG: DUF5915 domain-containing protein, partial [Cellulomonadaceae bacterium]|nr:DUF5915 domain-containing protein [Cellulomonadaceae bacterium]